MAKADRTGVIVGLAIGQLVIGPLSDAFGRKRVPRGKRAPRAKTA